jgi:hypothetical protein
VLPLHTAMLALAFLPGREVPLSTGVDLLHRVVHSGVSPAVLGVLAVGTAIRVARLPPTVALRHWGR